MTSEPQTKPTEPKQHTYSVSVLTMIDVQAPDAPTAKRQALDRLAQACRRGQGLSVRVEEVR